MSAVGVSREDLREAAATAAPTLLVVLMSASSVAARPGTTGRWMLAVLLAQALPLLVVRRAPRTVLVWTATVTAVAAAVGLPATNGLVAEAIAVAFVVARTGGPASVAAPVAVLAANIAGSWVGRVGDLPRLTVVTGTTLALGWVVGDAVRRRADVRAAMEEELVRRARHHRLQAEVGALSERLTIARELHAMVGEGLDAVVVQAAAARTRLGRPEALPLIAAIERVARGVLVELDRFLSLLRHDVPERDPDRTSPATPRTLPGSRGAAWLTTRGAGVALVAPAAAVGVLAYIDIAGVPQGRPVPGWWPLAFSVAVAVTLTFRRRRPETTLAALALLVAGHHAVGIQVYNGVIAIPVAVYALAVHRSRRRAAFGATSACLAPIAATAIGAPAATFELGSVLIVLTAVALYVGDTSRVAHEHNSTLLRRLEDVEAEGTLRRHAVVVEERTAAARDLHDSVGHALSLVIIQAGAARMGAGSGTPVALSRADSALAAIEEAARTSLAAVEAAVHEGDGTYPDLHEEMDLGRLVTAVRATGATVELDAVPTDDLPRTLRATVFRLVQEALTNVAKHAPGAAASVVVDRSDDQVRVVVANTRGRGRPRTMPSGGRGLTGMRERVVLFGGRLDVGPDADGGYRVDATVPVPTTADGARAPQGAGGVS